MTKKKYNSDQLGTRMKSYENVSDFKLTPRCPVIIRLDGNRFSQVTKKLPKPSFEFLNIMAYSMLETAKAIEGCVFGYTQSDEVTLILKNDQSHVSTPWFDNRLRKIASISASIMTMNFAYYFFNLAQDVEMRKILMPTEHKIPRFYFDSRVYVVPNEIEMFNTLYWRQLDCMKNAISMVTEYKLREKLGKSTALKLLHKKGRTERLQLLKDKCGIDFYEKYPVSFQRGVCAYKQKNGIRNKMNLDFYTPNFLEHKELIISAWHTEKEE